MDFVNCQTLFTLKQQHYIQKKVENVKKKKKMLLSSYAVYLSAPSHF